MTDNTDRANPYDVERDRGIFTSHDRKYLLDKSDLEGQDERNARYRIRQRLLQSLYDLRLAQHVTNDDLRQVLNNCELHTPASGLVEFAFRLVQVDTDTTFPIEEFEHLVGEAIADEAPPEAGEASVVHSVVSVDISVSNESIDVDNIEEKLDLPLEAADEIRETISDHSDDIDIQYNIITTNPDEPENSE